MRPMTFGWITVITVSATLLLAVVRGIVAWERAWIPDDAPSLGGPLTAPELEPTTAAALRPVA